MIENTKPIVYIDMDGVLVDFESGVNKQSAETLKRFTGEYDNIPHIFSMMNPIPGALEAVEQLRYAYDLYVLSSSPWHNPTAPSDKLAWIKHYFGDDPDSVFYKKVILSHVKHLNYGAILIDDRLKNGAAEFTGRHIHFGSDEFPDWSAVLAELL